MISIAVPGKVDNRMLNRIHSLFPFILLRHSFYTSNNGIVRHDDLMTACDTGIKGTLSYIRYILKKINIKKNNAKMTLR